MAPIKFEENIREKLQEREIKPNKDAWAKLSSQLENAPEKRRSPLVWFAVAASFIGVLLLVNFFVNDTEGNVHEQLVEQESIVDPSTNQLLKDPTVIEPVIKDNSNEVLVVENSSEKQETLTDNFINDKTETAVVANDKKKVDELKKGAHISEKKSQVKEDKESATSLIAKEEKKVLNNPNIQIQQPLKETAIAVEGDLQKAIEASKKVEESAFIEGKINEVVALVQDLKKQKNAISADEVDGLLKEAQRDIATNRILNQEGYKIDATALLNDVESELERTFRDRVFEALGEGYNKVRTAVAERNN